MPSGTGRRSCIGDDVLGVAAVDRVAGVLWLGTGSPSRDAQYSHAPHAHPSHGTATGRPASGHARRRPLDDADAFVARDERRVGFTGQSP